MNEEVKRLQDFAARLAMNPLIPADVRATVSTLALLIVQLVERVQQLEERLKNET